MYILISRSLHIPIAIKTAVKPMETMLDPQSLKFPFKKINCNLNKWFHVNYFSLLLIENSNRYKHFVNKHEIPDAQYYMALIIQAE